MLYFKYKVPLREPEIEFNNLVGGKALATDYREMETRAFTISYSKQKAKTKKDYEEDLIQEVSRLGNMVENYPSPETVQKYIKAKNELNKISYDRTRGACVRSKARWHEFGERSSKYFLNLERRNYENKCITSLIEENGSSITDPRKS